ncbi:hypothetical protein KIN20_021502 [Parelaphostrongylus tenuis]|uniref:Uncharacterized protein n=1 Tax=Parelaphostrongylus tenuis TaxID=148309 RepID=A0AAD5MP04_PARTN|nr:hypothetical protein KIN20_021502 [Parelaphostrongylus tenuis]
MSECNHFGLVVGEAWALQMLFPVLAASATTAAHLSLPSFITFLQRFANSVVRCPLPVIIKGRSKSEEEQDKRWQAGALDKSRKTLLQTFRLYDHCALNYGIL